MLVLMAVLVCIIDVRKLESLRYGHLADGPNNLRRDVLVCANPQAAINNSNSTA